MQKGFIFYSLLLMLVFFQSSMESRAQEGWWHPLRPPSIVPTPEQKAWAELEFGMMICIGVNTWAEKEVTEGEIPASVFNPVELDARQWVRVAKTAGMKYVILYVKHIDGFCLWPTAATDYSVKSSPWRNGQGDIVRDVADACRAEGLKFGIALCVIGSHEKSWVERNDQAYTDYLKIMVRELLTNYGDILTMWFDPGWHAGGRIIYIDQLYTLVKQLQPKTLISMMGINDTHWAGNEIGTAPETVWNILSVAGYPYWTPREADASTRTFNWYWDPGKEDTVISEAEMQEMFHQSVGHGTNLLLNVPPDRRGVMPEKDVRNLVAARRVWMRNYNTFKNLALNKPITATSTFDNYEYQRKLYNAGNAVDGKPETHWMAHDNVREVTLELDLEKMTRFNRVMMEEYISRGQRVESFKLEYWDGSVWQQLNEGTTIGHKKITRFAEVNGSKVRITLRGLGGFNSMTLREIGIYHWMDTPGDVTGDKQANVEDVVNILRRVIGVTTFTPEQEATADVDIDGSVSVTDAVVLLKDITGIII